MHSTCVNTTVIDTGQEYIHTHHCEEINMCDQHYFRFRPPSASGSQGVVPSVHLWVFDCLHRGLTLEFRAPLVVLLTLDKCIR
jgi:hypothetical protein